jgi:hypothetical protein
MVHATTSLKSLSVRIGIAITQAIHVPINLTHELQAFIKRI